MPNYCNNTLTLTAATREDADHLHTFLQEYENSSAGEERPTFFGYFRPEPDYEAEEDDAMPGWYWWRVNNWGTKWDASIHDIHWVDDYNVVLVFDTAWSPPTGVYQAMMDQGWGVNASYFEPGMCFVGNWVDGEEEYYEYSQCQSSDELIELIGEDLDNEWGISMMMEEYWNEEEEDGFDTSDSHSGVEDFGKKSSLAS